MGAGLPHWRLMITMGESEFVAPYSNGPCPDEFPFQCGLTF